MRPKSLHLTRFQKRGVLFLQLLFFILNEPVSCSSTTICTNYKRLCNIFILDVFTSSNDVIYVNQNQVEDGFAKYDIPGRVILNIYASKRRNDDLMFLDEFQVAV